jgi:tetratricopeptide (TPR) repeat protein
VRATVLDDPVLAKHAGRFVWLSIDAELAANAEFIAHHPVAGFPAFLVLDARSETTALRWYGSLTVAQLERLLEDGERAVAPGGGPAEQALAMADRLQGEGKSAEAIAAYAETLRIAPEGWTRRGRAVESLVVALAIAGDHERCTRVALDEAPRLDRTSSMANVAATGLSCALETKGDAPPDAAAIAVLEPLVREALEIEELLADDRSGLHQTLVALEDSRGADAEKTRALERWLAFLDAEGARAPDAETRAALDSHRVAASLGLGDPARAIPALEASERDLPEDYNPPARLALLYSALGRHDDALRATERALARAYGPRKLRIYEIRADVFEAQGNTAAARATLDEALQFAESLPSAQRSPQRVQQLTDRIEKLR